MVKVLFDHNMPPSIARALHELIKVDGHESYALRDIFKVNIGDTEYFTRLGSNGEWIVVSKDTTNAKRKAEKAAILNNKILAFYLSSSLQKRRVNEQAAVILWQWDKMLLQRQLVDRGLFMLPENRSKFRPI